MNKFINISIISAIVVVLINLYAEKISTKATLIPPAPELAEAHLGYRAAISDSYWLRLLQDFSYCGIERLEGVIATNSKGAKLGPNRTPTCEKGWAYSMLSLILDLDPRFHFAASMGGVTLSVVADDIAGASEIFKKSTDQFPNDWSIHYQAGYHHLVELEDHKSAIAYFRRAQKIGAPRWLPLLIAKIQSKSGQFALAESTLRSYIQAVKDDEILKKRAELKLQDLLDKKKKE